MYNIITILSIVLHNNNTILILYNTRTLESDKPLFGDFHAQKQRNSFRFIFTSPIKCLRNS